MNEALARIAAEAGLSRPGHMSTRLAFGLACVSRIEHLLEDARALAGLRALREYASGVNPDLDALRSAAAQVREVAQGHRGSGSIDGSAHAAVSATYALANAMAGQALEAASYAAYAAVYAYGGYAVNDPSAFEPEFAWQVEQLRQLLADRS